jgi:transposase
MEELKLEAVKQIIQHQLPVAEVATRLGALTHSLYVWVKRYGKSAQQREEDSTEAGELRRLRAEVKRLTEEREILKMAAAYFARASG